MKEFNVIIISLAYLTSSELPHPNGSVPQRGFERGGGAKVQIFEIGCSSVTVSTLIRASFNYHLLRYALLCIFLKTALKIF